MNCGRSPVQASGESRRVAGPTSSSGGSSAAKMSCIWMTPESVEQHLADVRDAALAVDQPDEMDDEIERARHLLADGVKRNLEAAISTSVSSRSRASRGELA